MKKDLFKTDKKRLFLKQEYNDYYYKFYKSYAEYIETMYELIRSCETCGIYYWKDSGKRCNCKTKENGT